MFGTIRCFAQTLLNVRRFLIFNFSVIKAKHGFNFDEVVLDESIQGSPSSPYRKH